MQDAFQTLEFRLLNELLTMKTMIGLLLPPQYRQHSPQYYGFMQPAPNYQPNPHIQSPVNYIPNYNSVFGSQPIEPQTTNVPVQVLTQSPPLSFDTTSPEPQVILNDQGAPSDDETAHEEHTVIFKPISIDPTTTTTQKSTVTADHVSTTTEKSTTTISSASSTTRNSFQKGLNFFSSPGLSSSYKLKSRLTTSMTSTTSASIVPETTEKIVTSSLTPKSSQRILEFRPIQKKPSIAYKSKGLPR